MTKTQKKRRWMRAGACIVVTGLVVTLWIETRQPSYNGHPISYWFNQLPLTGVFVQGAITNGVFVQGAITNVMWFSDVVRSSGRTYGAQREKANDSISAIRHMGTNG